MLSGRHHKCLVGVVMVVASIAGRPTVEPQQPDCEYHSTACVHLSIVMPRAEAYCSSFVCVCVCVIPSVMSVLQNTLKGEH